jgi:hypothetical protein
MSKKALTLFILPLLFLFGPSHASSANPIAQKQKSPDNQNKATGILQKLIVESGTVTMELDLNRLNGITSAPGGAGKAQFAVAANSFFPILVFNDLLRGPAPGSMALVPQNVPALPRILGESLNRLVVEKLPSGQGSDLAVRDAKTSFAFFNIVGHHYDYDAGAQLLTINNGRLTMSRDLANALGRPSEAGSIVGEISIGAVMQPIEITQFTGGEPKSVVMPPLGGATRAEEPTRTSGPDVIVGDLPDVEQLGNAGTQVGLGIATTSCNVGQ